MFLRNRKRYALALVAGIGLGAAGLAAATSPAQAANVWVTGHYGPYGHWHPGHWAPGQTVIVAPPATLVPPAYSNSPVVIVPNPSPNRVTRVWVQGFRGPYGNWHPGHWAP